MPTYRNDPRWLEARYPGKCRQRQRQIRRDDRIYYYPLGKVVLCAECGQDASADFAAYKADEEGY